MKRKDFIRKLAEKYKLYTDDTTKEIVEELLTRIAEEDLSSKVIRKYLIALLVSAAFNLLQALFSMLW